MTPEQEEQVRRALADAAHAAGADEVAMPPAVADRMDEVLAGLVASRTPPQADDPAGSVDEDELAARRRRRRPRVLVAAAAVCLVALGGPAVLRNVTSGGSDSASTLSSDSAGSATRPEAGSGGSPTGARSPSSSPAPTSSTDSGRALADAALPPPALRRATLQRDVQRVAQAGAVPLAAAADRARPGEGPSTGACRMPSAAHGDDVLAVRLDGEPATLVLAAPRHGTREARVYACDDVSSPTETTRVRVRRAIPAGPGAPR